MTARDDSTRSRRADPRLYLIGPAFADPAGIEGRLADALHGGDVAAVLLRLPAGDERSLINCAKSVAPVIQNAGAALLLDGHAAIAARSGADGAHLTGIDAFRAAEPVLKPERIAGCGGLRTRHDAMVVGEEGADYVMFGEPDGAGGRPSFEAVVERVAWWAEVFELPCIGYAATLAEVDRLAANGADFVAVGECIFGDTRGPAAALADAARRLLSRTEAVR
jgi:thiamine-phosphate pyrophosphorylase